MKVLELIAKLKEFDGELEVLVDGYEGGCGEPSAVEGIEIRVDYSKGSDYCGPHVEVCEWEDPQCDYGTLKEFIEEGGIISKAIIIRR